MTPRTLKSALDNGYVICKIYAKYNRKIRVTVQERFHKPDRKMSIDFWIDRDYFKRTYSSAYERC